MAKAELSTFSPLIQMHGTIPGTKGRLIMAQAPSGKFYIKEKGQRNLKKCPLSDNEKRQHNAFKEAIASARIIKNNPALLQPCIAVFNDQNRYRQLHQFLVSGLIKGYIKLDKTPAGKPFVIVEPSILDA